MGTAAGAERPPGVAILVEAALRPQIESSLEQYIRDLEREGFRALVFSIGSAAIPRDVRALLQRECNAEIRSGRRGAGRGGWIRFPGVPRRWKRGAGKRSTWRAPWGEAVLHLKRSG